MTPADIERMAREAGCFTPGASRNYWAVTDPMLARFAALVQANALSEAHAAIDASEAKIIRNASQGYPEGQAPRELTLVERIAALSLYAADYKRWLTEAEQANSLVQAAERERCADLCDGTAGVCEDIANGIKRSAAVSAAHSCARLIRGG